MREGINQMTDSVLLVRSLPLFVWATRLVYERSTVYYDRSGTVGLFVTKQCSGQQASHAHLSIGLVPRCAAGGTPWEFATSILSRRVGWASRKLRGNSPSASGGAINPEAVTSFSRQVFPLFDEASPPSNAK